MKHVDGARETLLFEDLTYEIIGAFYAVYNTLGYGFLESVYRNALVLELQRPLECCCILGRSQRINGCYRPFSLPILPFPHDRISSA
jgi:hypothetical protein